MKPVYQCGFLINRCVMNELSYYFVLTKKTKMKILIIIKLMTQNIGETKQSTGTIKN